MTITNLPMTLALSDGWTIGMFVVSLAYNGLLTIGLLYVKQSTSKVDTLEAEVKTYATELINSKIGHIEGLIEKIDGRLTKGDGKFDLNLERDYQLENKFIVAINELRRELAERFATRTEMDKLKEDHRKLEIRLAQQTRTAV